MSAPVVGKQYKFYKGGIFTVVSIKNEKVCIQNANNLYHIDLDFWDMPALSNDMVINRFTEYNKKTKNKEEKRI